MDVFSIPRSLGLFLILYLSLSVASLFPKAHDITPERLHAVGQGISDELFSSLEELSRLVDITYCVGATGIYKPFRCLSRCSEFSNFELLTTWNTGPLLSDSCGYIAFSHSSPKRIIIAFRGTYSITNTILDLSAYPQDYVPYTGDEDGGPRCANCTVHAGFMASWRTTRATLLHHVSRARQWYPDYELVLVGHSLGGAVAALAGLEMRLRGWDLQVTTFGEPRVGNEAFVEFLDERFGLVHLDDDGLGEGRRFRRVTHAEDPVPLLPLEEWGYKMHAGEIYILKPDLEPSASDIRLCEGVDDPTCIAGSGSQASMAEVKSIARDGASRSDLGRRSQDQTVLSNGRLDYWSQTQSPFSVRWDLIPARYRLWELLFAHRDYFSRLGLCVPGGDPTGLKAFGMENTDI